jgi:hypothetical protein
MDEATAPKSHNCNLTVLKGTGHQQSPKRGGWLTTIMSFPTSTTSTVMLTKAEEINLILLQPEVDLWRLRELALSEGGLVNGTFL